MQYSAAPIEAWVVDQESSQPLEGVIVVAHWQLYGGMHPDNAGELMIMETVTDQVGRFYFPAWGPKALPSKAPANARLANLDPEILLFKSGYQYQRIANELTMDALKNAGPPLRHSDWNGKTIKMERFNGNLGKYVRHVSSFAGNLRFIEDDCQWKIVPRMILELQKQLDVFKVAGIVTAFYSVDYLPMNKANEAQCGSPKEFFKGYLK
jgi:hypothetical protein